jgi:hypothetical protein
MNSSHWLSCSRWRLIAVAICAVLAPIIVRSQDAATLAKYDKNHNGRLDPDEIAAMQADQAKNTHEMGVTRTAVTLNPFEADATADEGYPHFVENHFFEKIDGLDTSPWRYAKIDNIEVLSRCPDETTSRFVSELRHRLQLMKPVGPERPIASLDCPMRLFLYQYEAGWRDYPNKPNGIPNLNGGKEIITLMVNLWSYEKLDKPRGDDAPMLRAADDVAHWFVHAQFLAQLWTEPFARWLDTGLENFYIDLQFPSDSVNVAWPPTLRTRRGRRESFAQAGSWPKIELLPMEAVFNPKEVVINPNEKPPIKDDPYWLVWEGQLGLFMRWALLGDQQRRKEAFWKFAARARKEPNTEMLFQECFGTSYAKVQAELAGYLQEGRAATEFPTIVGSANSPRSTLELSDATAAEVERFKNSVNDAFDHQGNA